MWHTHKHTKWKIVDRKAQQTTQDEQKNEEKIRKNSSSRIADELNDIQL